MRWLGVDLELDIDSNIAAISIFSTFSLACSIITIIIYLRIKTLRTLIYRFFFHVAINEIVSRISYLLLLFDDFLFFVRMSSFLIYLTDTNIIVLLAFTCFGMYQLILKQNRKLILRFNKIIIGLYIFSLIIAIISFVLSQQDPINNREMDLYRNVICLYFIIDKDKRNLPALVFTNVTYFIILMFIFINIALIIIFIKDQDEFSSEEQENDSTTSDQMVKSSLKLRAFRVKLIAYPLLGLEYYGPLITYSIIEHVYITNKSNYQENMTYFKLRYGFYNLFCFLNSIRGFVFFNVFIQNEKIKKFLFEKYLNFEIFKTIDKINLDEEHISSTSIDEKPKKEKIDKIKGDTSFNIETSFDAMLIPKFKKKKNSIKKDKNNNEKDNKINNDKKNHSVAGLINEEENDSDDEDEEEKTKEKDEK